MLLKLRRNYALYIQYYSINMKGDKKLKKHISITSITSILAISHVRYGEGEGGGDGFVIVIHVEPLVLAPFGAASRPSREKGRHCRQSLDSIPTSIDWYSACSAVSPLCNTAHTLSYHFTRIQGYTEAACQNLMFLSSTERSEQL